MLTTGIVIGLIQTVLGHPFDTLKTGVQLHPSNILSLTKNIIKNEGVSGLSKGSLMPLSSAIISNFYLFNGFDYLVSLQYSHAMAGGMLGAFSSIFMSPLEMLKCHVQASSKHKTYRQVINQLHCHKISLYKGFQYTFTREVLGCSSYFYLFFLLEESFPENSAINGGLTGAISWIISYPIDTIKTRYQVEGIISYKMLYKGFSLILARSIIVNSAIFHYYKNQYNWNNFI